MLAATYAAGEVDQFTPGNLIVWLLNVFGFNLIDSSSALPDLIILFFVLGVTYLVYKRVFK